MSFNKFAAGRKVYGQGATSPTRGAVDPSGYIKRELARKSSQQGVSKVGRDGQSDTRSGLAHNAIKNNLGNNVGRPGAQGMKQPNRQMGQTIPQAMGSNRGSATVGTTPTGGAPVGGPVPVQANANGILELPYNTEFGQQALDAQQSFDDELMTIGYEEQNQAQEYARFMRELESGYVDQQRNTLGNSAGNGMLYSSQYTTGANRDATDYNNTKNDATTQNTNFMSQMASRRNSAQTNFNQLIQQLTQGYAESLAAEAGNLGYGVAGAGAPSPSGAPGRGPTRGQVVGGNKGAGWGGIGRPVAASIKPPKPPKTNGGSVAQHTPPKKKGKK